MKGEGVTRIGFALSHPLRIEILKALLREEASATMLSRALGTPVSNVAYHLCRILYEACGLVVVTAKHQRRGATETVFAIKPGTSAGLLATAVAAVEDERRRSGATATDWQAVAVDGRGRREIEEALEQLGGIVEAAGRRSAESGSRPLQHLIVTRAVFA